MNQRHDLLKPYPFERLAALKSGIEPVTNRPHVSLSIGEPKHAPPEFVIERLTDPVALRIDLATYPATRGSAALRESIATWVQQRFGAMVDPETQVLPVAGTREALFSIAQTVLSGQPGSLALLPNPFYQIYEGATILAGATPYFVSQDSTTHYQPQFLEIAEETWRRTELVYLCSPSNPTGSVLPKETLAWLIEQAHRHDFVIVADECYSEIYLDEQAPPPGLLEVSAEMGNAGHAKCLAFHSLSKRSNLPGLRSGFVAGDQAVMQRYYLHRTYEGCALPAHVQAASTLAWQDEDHVVTNRALYREKFEAVRAAAPDIAPSTDPAGGFYWWLPTPEDDEAFARRLFLEEHITVLPGRYLAREDAAGNNPGRDHVRIAWVAPIDECVDAARHIASFVAG